MRHRVFLEIVLVAASLLAIAVASFYSIRLRSGAGLAVVELNRAKDLVQDVTMAFSSRLRSLTGSVEAIRSDIFSLREKFERLERLTTQENSGFENYKALAETTLKSQTVVVQKLNQLGLRVQGLAKDTDQLKTQIVTLDRRYKGMLPEPDRSNSLPIDSHNALSRLTETELQVLTFLAAEGPKPVPELKVAIGKTREHTARLMNSLFKEGFVERDTSALPYKYKVREELKKALQEHRSSNSQFLER